MTIKRRDFLGHVAAGSAVISMPTFLSGCGVPTATAVRDVTPENPFMTWFGVDQATTARVMSELLIRAINSLPSGSPGTIADSIADVWSSSRKPASRCAASGP